MNYSDTVERVLNRYIKLEEVTLKQIDEMEGSDAIGSTKWHLRNYCKDRLKLLNDIKEELM